ncbi:MAG: helix-turn-helix domain-containing protein [Lachnospiraceae bacterium]|nr:helix-turn-helix domain-containing protein [Lachnospiraceae bacterium]
MGIQFANTLKRLRTEKGLSQRELAEKMYVTRSTIARWENDSRLPDVAMITRLSQCLDEDINTLLNAASESDEVPNVILLDDTKITLTGGLPVLEEVLPNANVIGFTKPSEAIEYAKAHQVSLAFLDIELGNSSGLDICAALLKINPRINVIFVTAYSDYSLDAWNTGACGFMLKPLTPEAVRDHLKNLRYPFNYGGML